MFLVVNFVVVGDNDFRLPSFLFLSFLLFSPYTFTTFRFAPYTYIFNTSTPQHTFRYHHVYLFSYFLLLANNSIQPSATGFNCAWSLLLLSKHLHHLFLPLDHYAISICRRPSPFLSSPNTLGSSSPCVDPSINHPPLIRIFLPKAKVSSPYKPSLVATLTNNNTQHYSIRPVYHVFRI